MSETTLAASLNGGYTVRQQLELATSYLTELEVDEARENAELLMLHVLKLDRAQLLLRWQEIFPSEYLEEWVELLTRKGRGEPLQYMTGEAWFYGRAFAVTPDVLIPRPETELLVEAVLQRIRQHWPQETLTILDVGTGSGAISITLQLEQPKSHVIASDLSSAALAQAQRNAERYQVSSTIEWVEGDLLKPFCLDGERLQHNGRGIDILVSNPPYIPQADMAGLQREVQQYEPHLALVGGADGLDPYRAMLSSLQLLSEQPRIVAFELGIHQPAIVAGWLREMGAWDEVDIITDYAGIDRHILAIKKV